MPRTIAINLHAPKTDARIEEAKLASLQLAWLNFCELAQAAGVPITPSCFVASDPRDDV